MQVLLHFCSKFSAPSSSHGDSAVGLCISLPQSHATLSGSVMACRRRQINEGSLLSGESDRLYQPTESEKEQERGRQH